MITYLKKTNLYEKLIFFEETTFFASSNFSQEFFMIEKCRFQKWIRRSIKVYKCIYFSPKSILKRNNNSWTVCSNRCELFEQRNSIFKVWERHIFIKVRNSSVLFSRSFAIIVNRPNWLASLFDIDFQLFRTLPETTLFHFATTVPRQRFL